MVLENSNWRRSRTREIAAALARASAQQELHTTLRRCTSEPALGASSAWLFPRVRTFEQANAFNWNAAWREGPASHLAFPCALGESSAIALRI